MPAWSASSLEGGQRASEIDRLRASKVANGPQRLVGKSATYPSFLRPTVFVVYGRVLIRDRLAGPSRFDTAGGQSSVGRSDAAKKYTTRKLAAIKFTAKTLSHDPLDTGAYIHTPRPSGRGMHTAGGLWRGRGSLLLLLLPHLPRLPLLRSKP